MALGADDDETPGIAAAAHPVQHPLQLAAVAAIDAGLELAREVEALGIDLVHAAPVDSAATPAGFRGSGNGLPVLNKERTGEFPIATPGLLC